MRARLVASNDDMVRIEVGGDEITKIVQEPLRSALVELAHEQGFNFVSLDLEGFVSGRLNAGLNKNLVQLPVFE